MGGTRIQRRCAVALFAVAASFARAGVSTDGSLGKAKTIRLSGNAYMIGDSLGKRDGPNLFHSLRAFSVERGMVADFLGPAGVQNVLVRVTGGRSKIDGTIRTGGHLGGANFFLMNPAGVLFGPGARLDIKGSFAVTTGDYIATADGQ